MLHANMCHPSEGQKSLRLHFLHSRSDLLFSFLFLFGESQMFLDNYEAELDVHNGEMQFFGEIKQVVVIA